MELAAGTAALPGEKSEAIFASMTAVAEGYPTARSARELARTHDVETPIIEEVYGCFTRARSCGRRWFIEI